MNEIGRLLVIVGAIVLITGFVAMLLPSTLPKLPGDIYIKKGNFVFYFPIVTSILISILLTVIFAFLSKK